MNSSQKNKRGEHLENTMLRNSREWMGRPIERPLKTLCSRFINIGNCILNGVTVIAAYTDEPGDDVFRTEASLFSYRYWLENSSLDIVIFLVGLRWYLIIVVVVIYCLSKKLGNIGGRQALRHSKRSFHCESERFTIF